MTVMENFAREARRASIAFAGPRDEQGIASNARSACLTMFRRNRELRPEMMEAIKGELWEADFVDSAHAIIFEEMPAKDRDVTFDAVMDMLERHEPGEEGDEGLRHVAAIIAVRVCGEGSPEDQRFSAWAAKQREAARAARSVAS